MTDALTPAELSALSIFPLPNAALFPGTLLPLHVFEPRYRAMIRDALADTKALAVARLRPGFEGDYEGRPPVFEVCGAGRIIEHLEHEDGRYHLVLQGVSRVRIVNEHPPAAAYRVVRAEPIHDLPADPRLSTTLETAIRTLWQRLAPRLPEAIRDLAEVTRGAEDAAAFSDRLAAVMAGEGDVTQQLLAEADPCERLRLIAERLQAVADSVAPKGSKARSDLN
jgi:Lon protease-like protein